MAVVAGAILVVGWMALVWVCTQAYATRVSAPLQIIEVFGGGGGSPEGTAGSTEKVDVAGADAAPMASNNEEAAGDFEEPAVEQTPGAMLDTAVEAGQSLAEADLGAVMPSGGAVASGKRASKIGTGGPGLGFGPGDGGVSPEQRWSIIYASGQHEDEYARQLDALGVELAVVASADELTYISNFSHATPTKRNGPARGDHRLYFLWQGKGRKGSDIALLKKAGIVLGEQAVFFSSTLRPSNNASPSWKSASKAVSPARSASPGLPSSPKDRATTSRSSPRRHYASGQTTLRASGSLARDCGRAPSVRPRRRLKHA